MNWLSLTVNEYVSRCNFAIGKFTSLVHQLQKNIGDAEERLHDIETADLFRLPEFNANQLPDVTIFFDRLNKLRAIDIRTVLRKYNDIGPILTKVNRSSFRQYTGLHITIYGNGLEITMRL